MKRIFSILAIVCLLVALAVPAFAVDYVAGEGTWSFNDTLGDYSYPKTFNVSWEQVHPSAGLMMGNRITVSYNSGVRVTFYTEDNTTAFWLNYNKDGTKATTQNYWSLGKNVTIYAEQGTEVYNWLTANATYNPPRV